ncbi:monocarboxylate transporter 13-like [Ptychodera flava]|uniref:monocarboxylate transporter 13-like n=1 Tax=Ptychodera flava TaxID=63121 RepID=UPI00396A1695
MTSGTEANPHEGGFGWILVLASFVEQVLQSCTLLATGVLVPQLTKYFEADVAEVSTVFSVAIGLLFLMGPFSGFLVERYGTRTTVIIGSVLVVLGLLLSSCANSVYFLFFSFGILTGSGFGIAFTPTFAVFGEFFKDRLGLATSLSLTGTGFGCIIFSPLNHAMLENYGWRGWFILIAAIDANLFVCAALIRPTTKQQSKTEVDCHLPDSVGSNAQENHFSITCCIKRAMQRLCVGWIRKTKVFLVIPLAECLSALSYSTIALLIVPCAIDQGTAPFSASLLPSVVGISSTCVRVFSGVLLDLKCMGSFRDFIPMLSMLTLSIPFLVFPMTESYTIMVILCCLLGLAQGVYYPGLWVLVKSITGPNYTAAVGWAMFSSGIGSICGSSFGGVLYDNTQSYKVPFFAIGSATTASAFLYLAIALKVRSRKELQYRDGRNEIPGEHA